MTDDAKLLRGDFLNPKFTPDFSYLSHYFRTDLPACFIKYFIAFGHMLQWVPSGEFCQQFIDHTGLDCSDSRLRYLLNRAQTLTSAEREANDNLDLDTLLLIKEGKYKFVDKED